MEIDEPNAHPYPSLGSAYSPPHLTREQIEQLIEGKYAGSHPATASIIDDILSLQAAMASIDARRCAEGKLSPRDKRDWEMYDAPRVQRYRFIGLCPREGAHAPPMT
jgi:hypothetical protein